MSRKTKRENRENREREKRERKKREKLFRDLINKSLQIKQSNKNKGTDQFDLCSFPRYRSRKRLKEGLQFKLICTPC